MADSQGHILIKRNHTTNSVTTKPFATFSVPSFWRFSALGSFGDFGPFGRSCGVATVGEAGVSAGVGDAVVTVVGDDVAGAGVGDAVGAGVGATVGIGVGGVRAVGPPVGLKVGDFVGEEATEDNETMSNSACEVENFISNVCTALSTVFSCCFVVARV